MRSIIGPLLCCAMLCATPVAFAANALKESASPYLAMHGDDPIDWHDVHDRAALERARREGLPLFISSGYFSCHWCHVMQRETYSDPQVAEFINAHFVAFKVDRELDPVLDARLIRFVEYTQGVAGWPLNVVLTPEGHPFYGFTYLPKARFLEVMQRLDSFWHEEREEIVALARAADEELSRLLAQAEQPAPQADAGTVRAAFLKAVRIQADRFEGGFGESLKFPGVPQLDALLKIGEERDFLATTLDAMQDRNLRDHLHGGFFRYSTDPGWHTPHFEKMLYDNALLARLYLLAGRRLGRDDWRRTGLDTLRFIEDWMHHPRGGYIASLSAVDDRNREGGFYLWTREDIEAALDAPQRERLRRFWDYTAPPAFEAGNLPPRLPADADASLREIYRSLARHARETRHLPRDGKRLTSWNALLLSAFAACAPDETFCREAGGRLAGWLAERADDGDGLAHAFDEDDRPVGEANLEDHAFLIAALDDWLAAVPADARRLRPVRDRLLMRAWQRFHRPQGWLATDRPVLPGDRPRHHFPDTVLPSPTARLLHAALGTPPRGLPPDAVRSAACHITRGMLDDAFGQASWAGSERIARACGGEAGNQIAE